MAIYPQTVATQFPDAGTAGQPYDSAYAADDGAATVSETLGVEAGVAVIYDSTPGPVLSLTQGYTQKVKLPVDGTSVVCGFTLYQAIKEPSSPRFSLHDSLSFRKKGRIFALVQNTVNAGDDVFAWFAGTSTNGSIRSDAGSSQAVKVRGAKVLIGGATGGVAVIELNLPVSSIDTAAGSMAYWNVTGVKTSAYNAVIGDLVKVDPTAGTVTVTLPTAVGQSGKAIKVVDYGADGSGASATHTITIATTSSQKIDGASTKTITSNAGELTVVSDGVGWLSAAAA